MSEKRKYRLPRKLKKRRKKIWALQSELRRVVMSGAMQTILNRKETNLVGLLTSFPLKETDEDYVWYLAE